MTIALIRHGQTDYNAAGRMQGSSDIPLNATGRQQALDAGLTLAGGGWEVIVSSPLSRARETAEIIAGEIGLELGRSYDALIERDYGPGEGLTADEIVARFGTGVKDYPGIEALDDVIARGISALQRIADEYAERHVVVVCHGTIIRYTLAALAGRALDPIVNGSISTVELDAGEWRVLTINGKPLQSD